MSATPNPVGSGARAIGMGGAFISVADDATAASWNPAGLTNLKQKEISIVGSYFSSERGYDTSGLSGVADYHSDNLFRLNYLSAAFPFTFGSRFMVFSFNYQHLYEFTEEKTLRWSYDIPEASIKRDKESYIKQNGALTPVSPAVAVQITPALSLGITGNFWIRHHFNNYWQNRKTVKSTGSVLGRRRESFANLYERYDLSGFNLHLGCLWRISDSLRLGCVIKTPFSAHVLHRLHYVSTTGNFEDTKDNAYLEFSGSESFSLKMPLSYGIGATIGFLDNYLLVSLDVYHTQWDDFIMNSNAGDYSPINIKPKGEANIKPTTQVRLGIERLWIKNKLVFPVRAGTFYDPEPAEGRVDDFYGWSTGTGILLQDWIFDIAYQYRFGTKKSTDWLLDRNISAKVREHYFYSSMIWYF